MTEPKSKQELIDDYGHMFEGSDHWHLGQWRDALSEKTTVTSCYAKVPDYSTGYGSEFLLDSLIVMEF